MKFNIEFEVEFDIESDIEFDIKFCIELKIDPFEFSKIIKEIEKKRISELSFEEEITAIGSLRERRLMRRQPRARGPQKQNMRISW